MFPRKLPGDGQAVALRGICDATVAHAEIDIAVNSRKLIDPGVHSDPLIDINAYSRFGEGHETSHQHQAVTTIKANVGGQVDHYHLAIEVRRETEYTAGLIGYREQEIRKRFKIKVTGHTREDIAGTNVSAPGLKNSQRPTKANTRVEHVFNVLRAFEHLIGEVKNLVIAV